jgi:shikimate dehydrogenase
VGHLLEGRTRLAVLGSPIAHSRSPELQAAAYRVLGLDWEYGRAEVEATGLEGFLAGLGPEWRGLSLTMPLKREVLRLVPDREPLVERLGLANTVLLGASPRLFNTDVGGIERVLARHGVAPSRVVVLGAGATAASALEAVRRAGAGERIAAARDPERAAAALGDLATGFTPLAAAPLATADLVIATLPGGADAPVAVPAAVAGTPQHDVAYDPWPSPLGAAWSAAGGRLLHGLDMLLEQAVLQVRVFTQGDPDVPLPDEERVRTAMAAALA